MSFQRMRHFALALAVGLIPLLPATPVNSASTPLHVAPASATQLSSAQIAKIRDTGPPVMQQAADYVATAPLGKFTASAIPRASAPLAVSNSRLYREVFGFAFAGSIGDPTVGYPSWNMNLLSTVAYFGVHVDWTGGLVGDSGLTIWDNPNGPVPGLISTAHASGTKVVLTIIMGDFSSDQRNMCSALDRWQTTVQQTVSEVQAKGVDGVNIDYEGTNVTCMDPGFPQVSSQSLFTNLVSHMRAALPTGSYLSVDTYSGSAGYRNGSTYLGFFDIGALANYVDSFFVMAYDMEYENAFQPPLNCSVYCLGPTAPLTTYYWNDSRASSEYSAVVSPSQVIMGIPYYGRKECVSGYTPSNAPPNAPLAPGTTWAADGYLDAIGESTFATNSDYHTHRDVNDTQGSTEWDTWSSPYEGCNREMYYDDVTSLGNKYNLVINNHLRGIGIFALSYGGGAPELWSLIRLKFGQCSEAALVADHSSPQIPGPTITFNASALCAGIANFRFWMQAPGSTNFTLVKDYGTASTLTWNTAGKPFGTYTFQVDARDQGASVSLDTYSRISFGLGPCVTPSVTTDVSSPQVAGTTVTLTAGSPGCAHPLYQFWILRPGSTTWQIVQPYSSSPTFTWNTGLPFGTYLYGVWVRDAGGPGTFCGSLGCNDGFFPGTPFTLTSQPCTSVTDSPAPASPQDSATTVTFTASASGCPRPLYQFWILPSGSSTWQIVQAYSSTATFSWNTTALPVGSYLYTVWARDTSSPGTFCSGLGCNDAYSPANTYSLTTHPCTSVMESAAPGSPQGSGTSVTLTAGASGCPHPLYQFWILPPGSTTWQILQAYSPTSTFSWNTTGLRAGNYLYTVWARDASSSGTFCSGLGCNDKYYPATTYALTTQPCTSVTDAATPGSPQPSGTSVTFTASASGCSHPLYQFWILRPGSQWQIVQPYSTNASFTWNTTGLPAGSYLYTVWARDSGGTGTSCSSLGCNDAFFPGTAYSLTTQACTSVTESAAPGSPQLSGTAVTFTANASGCAYPYYQFWIKAPGQAWQIVQPYSTSNTFTWNTGGLPAGSYLYTVWARGSGGNGTTCSYLGCNDAFFPGTSYTLS